MDRSRHTVTKYLTGEKAHAAIISKLFKKLDYVNNSLYEVELAKPQIEHKEKIPVGFFILQYAKLRLLELYYTFFTRCCDLNKFEVFEMVTDLLYLALAHKRIGRLYKTWNESWMAEVAVKWLCRYFHCWCCSKCLPPNMLCKTLTTW